MSTREDERRRQALELEAQGQELLTDVNLFSHEAARGDVQAGIKLIYSLVPESQDRGRPKNRPTPELLSTLPPRAAAAIKIAHWFSADFNRNLGWHISGKVIIENDPNFQNFVVSLGKTVQEMLGGFEAPKLVNHIETTLRIYHEMLFSFEAQLDAAPRS